MVALPYHSGAPSFAVPVPPFASAEGHPHLWRTCVWLGPDERFSLWPSLGALHIENIKRNLMLPAVDAIRVDQTAPEPAACAFLALQLRQARGWMATSRPEVIGHAPMDGFANIGIPAAALDNGVLAERFRRVCAAALLLNETDSADDDSLPRSRFEDLYPGAEVT